MHSLIQKSLVFLFLLYFPHLLFSQNNAPGQKAGMLSFTETVQQLEQIHHVKFFYKLEWFAQARFPAEITEIPFQEALSSLKLITKCTVRQINYNYYVLIPPSKTLGTKENYLDEYYVIGDRLSYGSKKVVNVEGTIVDENNNETLPHAQILIADLNKTIISDVSGKFNFTIPVGDHEIKASYSGFEDYSRKIRVLSDGELIIGMLDKAINVGEVVITSNKIDQNFRRTQMSVMRLQGKNIKELPNVMGNVDVIKSLSLMPGIQSTGEFGSGFNVRGGGSDQNLIMIQDVPVFNTSHLFGLTSVVNPDGITSMTLFKGGIPANYGERASSVLNIIMGSEDLKKIRVKGGVSLIDSRLNIEVPVSKKLVFMVGGRTSYSDWILKSIPDADLMNSSASFYDIDAMLTYNINSNDKLTIFGYSSNDNFKVAGTESYKYGNLLGSIKYNHAFSNRLFTSLNAGISRYKSKYTENDTLTPMESNTIDNGLIYKDVKWNLIWELNQKHVITTGIDAILYNVQPGMRSPYGPLSTVDRKTVQDEQGFEGAVFLSDDYKVSDKVSLELGVRYSSMSALGPKKVYEYKQGVPRTAESIIDSTFYKKGAIIKTWAGIEPRISFRYNLTQNSSLRLSYNRIHQYINLVSNTSVVTPSDLWKLSDTYIKPLISDQIAVGYFHTLNKPDIDGSIEAYFKQYQNLIDYKNSAQILLNDHIETDLLNAKGYSYGLELYIKKNSGKLTGWMSYTYSRALRRTYSAFLAEKINRNEYYPDNLDRPHNLVINAGYYLNRRWKVAMTFNYITGRPVTFPEQKYTIGDYQIVNYSDRNKYRMPDYHRLDISISQYESLKIKKAWKGYWTLSIINVYGRKNAYSFFYKKENSSYTFNSSTYNLYKLYIIGRPLPTITYNFIF